MPLPAACLFDLDGLLLDTEPLHAQAWREAAGQFSLTLSERDLLQLRGRRRLDCVAQVREWIECRTGAPAPSGEALLAVQQPVARRLMPGALPVEGAEALVASCQEHGVPMAMVTSSTREAVALKCAPHGWLGAIEERVLGDDPELRLGKPAPDPYLLAARRLGVPAAGCWAFEDSPAGALSAVLAGCQVHVLLAPGLERIDYPREAHCWRSLRQVRLPCDGGLS
ncbi:MAG: HAD family phosphatase [Cyanobacteriota bacterium]|nr:HAD family phosphatase [Cyanobacteriota bacterium]